MKYITGRILTKEEAIERFKLAIDAGNLHPQLGFFTVRLTSSGEFIGLAKIVNYNNSEIEIGYSFLPEYWSKGYATEVVGWLLDYAESIGVKNKLIAIVAPENSASSRVLVKSGFQLYKNGMSQNMSADFYRIS